MRDLGVFHLNVPGVHNVLNATAAIGGGLGTGRSAGTNSRGRGRVQRSRPAILDSRRGAWRHGGGRLRASSDGSESDASGSPAFALRQIRVLFQPHRFSRTKHLLDEFGTAFHQADDLYLLDIYAASEPEIEGVTTESSTRKDSLVWASLGALCAEHGRRRCGDCARPQSPET